MDCGKTAPFVKVIDSSKIEKNNAVMPITFPNVAYGNLKNQLRKLFYLKMLQFGPMRKMVFSRI
jgi:hypothetical protein